MNMYDMMYEKKKCSNNYNEYCQFIHIDRKLHAYKSFLTSVVVARIDLFVM